MLEPPLLPGDDVQQLLKDGIALVKSEQYNAGVPKLRQVAKAQPDNANAWLWLGWAAVQQKDLPTPRAASSAPKPWVIPRRNRDWSG